MDNKEKIKQKNKKYNQDNKEKIKQQRKKYREKNKEQIKEQRKKYNKENKEKIKQYDKKYNEDNKEKIKENSKKYYHNNKEKINQYGKKYKEDNKEELNKKKLIYTWTSRGITFGDMNKSDFYDNDYMNCKFCMSCNVEFDDVICNNRKELDHLYHDIPLNIRGVICKKCNTLDQWIKYMSKDSIYNNYVEQYYLDKELNIRTE